MLGGAEYKAEGFRKVINVNLTSVMACAMKFRELLAASKGAVVYLNSVGGIRGNREMPAYDASKAALESLTLASLRLVLHVAATATNPLTQTQKSPNPDSKKFFAAFFQKRSASLLTTEPP